MYHCRLKIVVYSTDHQLCRVVQTLMPLDQFSHDVVLLRIWDPQFLEDSRIVIWDLPDAVLPSELRAAVPDAVLVFCAAKQDIDRFGRADLGAADEFWVEPLNLRLAGCRLRRLLQQIKLECDLRFTEACLETSINNTPDMVWFKSADGTHVRVNQAFCATVGKSRMEVTGKDYCTIWGVSRDDPNSGEAECRATEEAVIQAGGTLQFIEHVKGPHGMRQLITYKSPLYDWGGKLLGTVGLGHDVTDLENLSTELEILLQSMPYAILLRDKEGCIRNVNRKFEEYFGIQKRHIAGKSFETWNKAAFAEGRAVNSEGFVEAVVRVQEGTGRTLEIHEETIHDIFRNAVGKLCIYRDVTMERELEARILLNSNTDFMTGLYNRRCLYQYVYNNCRDQTVSMLYVDLDRFKAVNDTYGHKVGDEALILTAKLLRECFPEDFVARIGGDEFLIVKCGYQDISALEQAARLLLERLRASYAATEHLSELSASIGIAQNTAQEFDIDLLIQQSDTALYQAKQSGRARYCVFQK